ncbi:RCC1 [Lepeophtheirus salmonis]|uniref:RCC1 n=1 Tax=Lepeophtheirus salmonis TaxID=72036 RepID=A0A7R8D131_LEPSM|nr:RCC1 [Lepeophtheirus salmonis]CAF2991945.1 RCC1 [Lepeophtheirus salmonis]
MFGMIIVLSLLSHASSSFKFPNQVPYFNPSSLDEVYDFMLEFVEVLRYRFVVLPQTFYHRLFGNEGEEEVAFLRKEVSLLEKKLKSSHNKRLGQLVQSYNLLLSEENDLKETKRRLEREVFEEFPKSNGLFDEISFSYIHSGELSRVRLESEEKSVTDKLKGKRKLRVDDSFGMGRAPRAAATVVAEGKKSRKRPATNPALKENGLGNLTKRGRTVNTTKGLEGSTAPKKLKLEFRNSNGGVCLSVGQGDTGQLGLGEDVLERSKPGMVKNLTDVVEIVAGGMHSLCLSKSGVVYSFGCNDEGGSLGRETLSEEDGAIPGKGGHSTQGGDDLRWRLALRVDSSGSFGLTPSGKMEKLPVPLAHHLQIKKISSGTDHVALLSTCGAVYTVGCAEQGQLGRVGERFSARGGRRGLTLLLQPDKIHSRKQDDDILVCGLNNYNQLGVKNVMEQTIFSLVKSDSFSDNKWRQIALGQHHTLALDHKGKVYALGRNDYGRLGLGKSSKDAAIPTLISGLADKNIVDVSCGTTVSFAVTESGECFSWGMGTNGQLAHDDDEDSWSPEPVKGKQLESRKVILASGGGQHTLLLAK